MPYAQAEGCKLYYQETGHGAPIVFVHEFGADHREWETQVRFFSREYRCITYAARGYPPSEVPEDGALYGQDFAAAQIRRQRSADMQRLLRTGGNDRIHGF